MLRFREFLSEAVGQKALEEIIFVSMQRTDIDSVSFMRQVLLPMSKRMSQRLFGERNRIVAGHITSESNMGTLKSMEGTQKSLACMTNPTNRDIWFEGVATHGGIVCIVEGYPTLISNIDLYSRLGPQGRRFIPLSSLLPRGRGEFEYPSAYSKMLEQLRKAIVKQIKQAQERIVAKLLFTPMVTGNTELIDYIIQSKFHNLHRNLRLQVQYEMRGVNRKVYGKIMEFCIKMWFDEMEKIWSANWKRLQYIFDPEKMTERKLGWDEINLVDIKILECYIVRDVTPVDPAFYVPPPPGFDEDEDPDTAGIPIAGYIDIALPDDDVSIEAKYTPEGLKTVRKIEAKLGK